MSQSAPNEPAQPTNEPQPGLLGSSQPRPSVPASQDSVATPDAARALAPAYGRFYAPLAILAALLSVVPIFEIVIVAEGHTRTFGNLWQMASTPGGGAAMAGILLLGTVVGLLATAAARPVTHPAFPGTIAGLAILVLIMLLARPATGAPKPGFSPFGNVAISIAVIIIAVSVAHAIHLGTLWQQRPRTVAGRTTGPTTGAASGRGNKSLL